MKTIPLIVALGVSILSCENINAQDAPAKPASGGNEQPSGYWEKLTMQPFMNAQGMVFVELPLPSTWKVMRNPPQGEPTITGPNGTKVFDFPLRNFTHINDPNLLRSYQMSGQPLRRMPGIAALIQQDLVPFFENMGLRLLRHYEIPELTKIDQWYNDQLFKAVPGTNKCTAIGSNWENAAGEPHFLVTHLMVGDTAQMHLWYYWSSGLQAEKAHFPTAKKQLVFSLANARYNPQQITAFNQSEAQKAGKSWAEFNRRMAANQATFEAQQRAHVNRSNAINDAIMSGWRERNAASDKAHGRFIDTINEKTNVVDPTTGQGYKVDSGSNHYWMNSDGKYISSDKPAYDPNLDETFNRQNWQKLENAE